MTIFMKEAEDRETGSPLPGPYGRRHFTHKRMERWIRLQQFVYGLPEDYAYAVCSTMPSARGPAEARALVTVGWMTWFGSGKGSDPQHALALALLNADGALSTNGPRAFLHRLRAWLFRRLRFFPWRRGEAKRSAPVAAVTAREERLAG